MQIDMRTVLLLTTITLATCTLLLLEVWAQNRRYPGLLFLVADFFLVTCGIVLIALRGTVPAWSSTVLANTLTVVGAMLGYEGLLRFFGEKRRQMFQGVLLVLFLGVHTYYTYVQPSLAMRTLNTSVAIFLVAAPCAWFLWHSPLPELRSPARWTSFIFGGYGLISVVRVWFVFLGYPRGNDFFHSGNFDSIVLIAYQTLFILLTHSLVLMVNRRILGERALQEEKFSKAFHTAPYAIAITRLRDGRIFDVNNRFTDITGYGREDALGKNTRDLPLWENPMDREKMVDLLRSRDQIRGLDCHFRKKDGSRLEGEFSAAIITLGGEPYTLSSIADITSRKKAEEEIRTLLREKELLLAEIHHRVKNNLGAIVSLLSLQTQRVENAEAVAALQDAESRVHSMLVLYERLYRTGAHREIPLRLYLPPLAEEIVAMFPGGEKIHVDTDMDDTVLGVKETVPLGIIVNELLTNAMKYAFRHQKEGHIFLSAHRDDAGRLELVVQDDGSGMPDHVDVETSPGFGLQVVRMLMIQLDGTIRIERERGTRFVIDLPLPKEMTSPA